MPEIDALSTGKKVGNILNETLLIGGGATTATTPTVTIPRETATTNTVEPALRSRRTSSGVPAIGIGVSHEFEVETAAANNEIGATIEAVTTDVTNLSEDFDLVFKLMAAGGAATEVARMLSTGLFQVPKNSGMGLGIKVSGQTPVGIGRNGTVAGLSLFGDQATPADNNAELLLQATHLNMTSALILAWCTTNVTGGKGVGLSQAASGVLQLNTGTANTYTGTALRLGTQTIAQLPAAATAGSGARATVSDALAPTFQATVTAGGAVITPVYSDGAAWKVG